MEGDEIGTVGTAPAIASAVFHATGKRIRDFIGGVRSGVNGTPAFFINGVRHNGSYAYEDLLARGVSLYPENSRRAASDCRSLFWETRQRRCDFRSPPISAKTASIFHLFAL
jgi:hypothetical protein